MDGFAANLAASSSAAFRSFSNFSASFCL